MPDGFGLIFKGAIASVAEQAVAAGRSGGIGRENTALDDVDVEPTIAVVVQQAHASRCGLGELAPR